MTWNPSTGWAYRAGFCSAAISAWLTVFPCLRVRSEPALWRLRAVMQTAGRRLPGPGKVRIIRRHDSFPLLSLPCQTPLWRLANSIRLGIEAGPRRPGRTGRFRGLSRCRGPGKILRQALDGSGQGLCAAAGAVHRAEAGQGRLPQGTRCPRLPARALRGGAWLRLGGRQYRRPLYPWLSVLRGRRALQVDPRALLRQLRRRPQPGRRQGPRRGASGAADDRRHLPGA